MSNTELKPCPFCGGKAKMYAGNLLRSDSDNEMIKVLYLRCTSCGAKSGAYTRAEMAKEAWNRRANE